MPAPEWLITEVCRARRGQGAEMVSQTRDLLDRLHLPTVCDSACCPNRGECFSHHTATFLILGRFAPRLRFLRREEGTSSSRRRTNPGAWPRR